MTRTKQVTTFALEENGRVPVKIRDLIDALNEHVKTLLAGESFCCARDWDLQRTNKRLPERYRWPIAFAAEGENEGWYVHVGALKPLTEAQAAVGTERDYDYIDFGFVKLWDAERAYAVAKEAQRFLTAARWNY